MQLGGVEPRVKLEAVRRCRVESRIQGSWEV